MNNLAKNNLLFGILFSSFSTPFIFFVMGLPMILQLKGFEASIIGLFQLVGLPMVLKFLFSPIFDQRRFKNNHYKKWIFIMGIIYSISLFWISFLSLDSNINIVFVLILLTSIISTIIDIPLNALAIKVFKKEERISAGSYKISSFFLAGILGGGILLLFYNHLGWRIAFIIMAFMVLLSLFSLYFIIERYEKIEEQKVSFSTIILYFKQENIGIWIFVLSFYFVFISSVWVFMKPYLITKGIKPDDVAIYVGIYGGLVGFIGGILANYIGKKFTKRVSLLLFLCINIISVLILIFIENSNINTILLVTVVSFTALSIAFSSAIIFSMIMDYSRTSSRAIDYSIQSSLFSLTRIIFAVIAGILVSSFSFNTMFLFVLLGMLFIFIIIYKFFK